MGQITITGVSVALILSNPVIRHFDDLTFVSLILYLFSAALIPYSMYQSLGVSACVFPRINICLEALKGFPEEWEIPRRRTMFEIVFTITILFGMVIGTFSHIPDFGVAAVKTGSVHDVMRVALQILSFTIGQYGLCKLFLHNLIYIATHNIP
ncbi:unnamed protein product [Orchesella dallaii]|uniref:Amino acid transporter transmembrane domain-containing protein n=1 Tax=Orchesella dallaii TaxID=48710 RepID=A0ABP1RNX9_9HEXA